MILQTLYDYYQRKCAAADPAERLPAYGLEEKEIPFVLEITADGELVQLRDTRSQEGRKKVGQARIETPVWGSKSVMTTIKVVKTLTVAMKLIAVTQRGASFLFL